MISSRHYAGIESGRGERTVQYGGAIRCGAVGLLCIDKCIINW
jgi:hypothetical protein